jgi:hypothetical protein
MAKKAQRENSAQSIVIVSWLISLDRFVQFVDNSE